MSESSRSANYCGDALEGLKVLDFTWVMAGPLCTKYLADNGATVVRIESRTRPDTLRLVEPYKDGIKELDRSASYAFYNPNKYNLALNLRHGLAERVVTRLVQWADVVAENFAPGKIDEMGLGYERLKQINPGIIMLQVSIQGQTGPHSRHPGYGVLAAALSGITGLTGQPDRPPATPVAGYTDLIVPRFATAMLLAALDFRRRTGQGQCIDVSQMESTLQFLAPSILDYTVNGRVASRQGNISPAAVPHNAYRCSGDDRWCAISVSSDDEWRALCRVMGRPEIAAHPDFRTYLARKRHEAEIDKIVGEWSVNLTVEDAVERLQRAGVPAGIVQSAADLVADPPLERSLWLLDHRKIGPVHHLGQPFVFSRSGGQPCKAAACLGENTEYICKSILQMPDDEFTELSRSGVFE